jgi:organic hydroperoxide reductase OsmC/OhrA
MAEMTVQLRSIRGTEAALGRAGSHTLTVDRPAGKAGGSGLGFNGGELLGLAIGGCLCNDLQYVAHDLGIRLGSFEIDVTLQFEGSPTLATGATVAMRVEAEDKKADIQQLIDRAIAISTIVNSVKSGVPIRIARISLPPP